MDMEMYHGHASCPCPSSCRAVCPCLCCISKSVLHGCMSMSMLHVPVNAVNPCSCRVSMSMQHVPVHAAQSWLCCLPMSMLHVHVHAACPWPCSDMVMQQRHNNQHVQERNIRHKENQIILLGDRFSLSNPGGGGRAHSIGSVPNREGGGLLPKRGEGTHGRIARGQPHQKINNMFHLSKRICRHAYLLTCLFRQRKTCLHACTLICMYENLLVRLYASVHAC